MSDLNWEAFEALQGDPTNNWEMLCRELVRRSYARFGKFRSVKKQAGIEFSVDLESDCELGRATRHWGWQCRWFTIDAGKQIGKLRRDKIEKAIRTTEKHYPTVTDWVLWTRRSLTPTDQTWFNGISTKLKLHLWADEEVQGHLVGDAAILKEAYFGDLILTHERLNRLHEEAIAPIRKRWEPALHVEVEAERFLKATLAVPGTWPTLHETGNRMEKRVAVLASELTGLREDEQSLAESTLETLRQQRQHLREVEVALEESSLDELRNELENPIEPTVLKNNLVKLSGRLRAVKHPASISIAGAISEISSYFQVLQDLSKSLEQNFFCVIGDAGFGKTFLAAEITKQSSESPGGVLLLAKYLPKGGTLDDLANRLPFGGSGMEQLLEAVDAAAARFGRRIPIVIDGVNESENPRDWKDLLETAKVRLNRFKNCILVVTVRSAIADEILPPDADKDYLRGFQHDSRQALRTYFDYYKIDATDAILPMDQLRSPLFLSLFCQATNPDRKEIVGVDRIPRSLTSVFESYRQVVVSRAAEALDLSEQDVEAALERVGLALWTENARSFDFDELRELVGDGPRDWASSLARVLEEEGVLTRDPYPHFLGFDPHGQPKGNQVSAIIYDAFAGFIIADAILNEHGMAQFPSWLNDNVSRLGIESDRHPFAEDILVALVGLLPRRHHCQLWPLLPSPLRDLALRETTDLEPERIDDETRNELVTLCRQRPTNRGRDVLLRLWSTRSAERHPLNSKFLDEVLQGLLVSDRDLRWTEWLRDNRKEILEDLESLEDYWRRGPDRTESDHLTARWVRWTLSSSVRFLRDQATKTLYWYGLGAPQEFFELVIESTRLNDPYIAERMFAGAYGVLMGSQCRMEVVSGPIKWLLVQCCEDLVGPSPNNPTNHWATRVYVQGIVEFSRRFFPELVPANLVDDSGCVRFEPAEYRPANSVSDKFDGYVGHDFENYEVGRLFKDRGNYDFEHEQFSSALLEIRGRIHELGYSESEFKEIDSRIADHYTHRNEPSATERYVKKYGWIGFQEKAGVLSNEGTLCHKPRSAGGNPILDIDPSFPDVPPILTLDFPDWNHRGQQDDAKWLASGDIVVPDQLLRTDSFRQRDEKNYHWLAVDGFVQQSDPHVGRRTFGFIRGFLVAKTKVEQVLAMLKTEQYLRNDFIPREPEDFYTFAGEIPWSDEFACDDDYDESLGPYKGHIGRHWSEGPIGEVLSHSYSWESYHSAANKAGCFSAPSKLFSEAFKLASQTSSFDQVDNNGCLASRTFSPPEKCDRDGNLLYLREDLVRTYAEKNDAVLVWAVWGERILTNLGHSRPDWARTIYESYGFIWRRILTLSDL